MTFTVQIGSGRALFALPNNRFDQITKSPLRIAEVSARSNKEAKKP